MEIDLRPTASLKPYPNNPRKISKKAVESVARSIKRFGFRQPIVVDSENVVIVGHVRLKAALKLGLKEVPVHVSDLTSEQAQAYRLADNRSNEFAIWDDDLLIRELRALSEFAESDLEKLSEMTAFDKKDLERLLGPPPGETDPDDIPPAPDPVCKPRDIWVLGKHRLMCGNSENSDDVTLALNGAKPNLMITDPPYGVNYDSSWRYKAGISTKDGAFGQSKNDDRCDWQNAYALFPGFIAYVWMSSLSLPVAAQGLDACGFIPRSLIIWDKGHIIIGRGHYHWRHESCWYAVKKGAQANWRGDRKSSTIWEIDNPRKSETGHSAQKPVECMERPIRNHAGDVYDPFVGSGTSIIAAERQNRTCYAMEIAPGYVDVAVAKWEAYTGNKASRV